MASGARRSKRSATFIVSDERNPKVKVSAGMKLEVQSVKLVDPRLGRIKKIGARLCGGSGTCLALIEIPRGDPAR